MSYKHNTHIELEDGIIIFHSSTNDLPTFPAMLREGDLQTIIITGEYRDETSHVKLCKFFRNGILYTQQRNSIYPLYLKVESTLSTNELNRNILRNITKINWYTDAQIIKVGIWKTNKIK